MSVFVYHGDDQADSFAHYQARLDELRAAGTTIITIDGRKAELAALTDALAGQDFFGGPQVVAITQLFSRPKSKIRDAWCQQISQASRDVLLWQDKKLTPAALKSLPTAIIYASSDHKAIWQAVSLLSADNNNQRFLQVLETAIQQADSQSDPGIYLTATFLWQIQQLIDVKTGHFHGPPFSRSRLQNQASGISLSQLIHWHQKLIELDFRAKTGQLSLPASEELILILTALI